MYIISNVIQNDILDIKLKDLRCKHVFNEYSEKSKGVLNESNKIGYTCCKWGSHLGNVNNDYHIERIRKMESENYEHPLRIVKCDYSFNCDFPVWTDNLHSTIMYIRKYGNDVTLRDIGFYYIDLIDNIIYSYKDSLILNKESLIGAINCAKKRKIRSDSIKLIEFDYRVSDFLVYNEWLLN